MTSCVDVIHGYAQEVEASHDVRHHRDTPSSFSGLMGAGNVAQTIELIIIITGLQL